MKLFTKILIANRAEIAVRIIRSAREMNIKSVAVFEAQEREALHVRMADEAFLLQGNSITETYLNSEQIIRIALKASCDAIHPGYGFLAENADFAEACAKAGIVFIGPSAQAIRAMGNKIASRELAKKAGLPMTQGITGNTKELIEKALTLKMPLLVKAAAGGGGKGMRIVRNPEDLPSILEATSREALTYFGDEGVYIEKYIENPRHIEIQILGDNQGHVIHLFERECTIQRRYQKIIEESPSASLTDSMRTRMGDAAVKIAKSIGYSSVGTIEFLVDQNMDFYFLEMNTRIQVEHPVTEMVTGIDIVKEQIRIAAGFPLSIRQDEVIQKGHAIECRVYAEDPLNNFMPSPGDILLYSPPKGKNIRVDSSLDGPEKISGNYDPMIAKLIVWGENRVAAIDASVSALENFHIQGIMNNMVFLRHILSLNDFRENKISTAFCDVMMQEISQAMHLEKRSISRDWVVIALIVKELYSKNYKKNVWNEIGYWRHMMTFNVFVDDQSLRVEILDKRKDITQCKINGIGYKVEFVGREDLAWRIRINDETVQFFASDDAKGKTVISIQSIDFYAFRQDKLLHGINFGEKEAGSFIGKIVSPMPGKVIKLNVKSGELVSKNQVLMIVEAMKMENNILAPYDGQVDDVYIVENQMVDTETELIVLSEKISD